MLTVAAAHCWCTNSPISSIIEIAVRLSSWPVGSSGGEHRKEGERLESDGTSNPDRIVKLTYLRGLSGIPCDVCPELKEN